MIVGSRWWWFDEKNQKPTEQNPHSRARNTVTYDHTAQSKQPLLLNNQTNVQSRQPLLLADQLAELGHIILTDSWFPQ